MGDINEKIGVDVASGALAGTAISPGVGTIIGAGMGLLGGALSNQSGQDQADKGMAAQREALQNSIQWRVADAKKAGIHPLYALNAPAFNVSPITYEDKIGPALSNAGQSFADYTRSQPNKMEQAARFMEYQVAQSQVNQNDAQASYYRALAAKTQQDSQSIINPNGLGIQPENGQMPTGGGQGMINLKAAEQLSMKKGHEYSSAGVNPAYQLRYLDKGLPMYMPIAEGDSPEETISEMSFPAWAGLLMRNSRIFGPGWMKDMINSRYLGMEPQGVYNPRAERNKPKGKGR
ncbi:MAG: DNA pilot protein [Microviridae sp.]|nr:MAG: DNA pilot protein [Microviridae sp.]